MLDSLPEDFEVETYYDQGDSTKCKTISARKTHSVRDIEALFHDGINDDEASASFELKKFMLHVAGRMTVESGIIMAHGPIQIGTYSRRI